MDDLLVKVTRPCGKCLGEGKLPTGPHPAPWETCDECKGARLQPERWMPLTELRALLD